MIYPNCSVVAVFKDARPHLKHAPKTHLGYIIFSFFPLSPSPNLFPLICRLRIHRTLPACFTASQIHIYCFYLFYCFFFEILFLYFVNIRKFFDRRYSETTKKFFCRSKYNGMSYCIESSQFFY